MYSHCVSLKTVAICQRRLALKSIGLSWVAPLQITRQAIIIYWPMLSGHSSNWSELAATSATASAIDPQDSVDKSISGDLTGRENKGARTRKSAKNLPVANKPRLACSIGHIIYLYSN